MRGSRRLVVPFGRWSPKRLFLSGAAGVWLDPSDPSTIFQNSDGTNPAGIGDPVGYVADKSGNGNHAIQATAGKRPIRRAGGYLEFDGTDDCLQIVSCTLPTYIYLCAGFQQTNAKFLFIEHSSNSGSASGFAFAGTSNASWQFSRGGLTQSAPGVAAWPGTSPVVGELLYNTASGAYWGNGILQSNGSVGGTLRADADLTDALNIGSRNQASLFLQGRLYGLTISPAARVTHQGSLRTWMGASTGGLAL